MPKPARRLALALLPLLFAPAARSSPQITPLRPPVSQRDRVEVGGDIGRYEASYGTHMLCGERHCIATVPVHEMVDVFLQQAPALYHHKLEVIGAIDVVSLPTDTQILFAFKIWSFQLYEGADAKPDREHESTLESLVRSPEAASRRPITVTCVFRGANLFDDLPNETRRSPEDWVLKDGAFSVWVSGKQPKGSGWSLDPRSKSDCVFRIEVAGRVETANGYVYLRAQRLTLLGPLREGAVDPAR